MKPDSEWSIKITGAYSRVYKADEGHMDGSVITQHGIVLVYSQGGGDENPYTSLTFALNGRMYSRGIRKRFSKRGLVTKARQFATDVAEFAHD